MLPRLPKLSMTPSLHYAWLAIRSSTREASQLARAIYPICQPSTLATVKHLALVKTLQRYRLWLVCLLLCSCGIWLPLAQAQAFDPERGEFRIVILNDINSSYGATHYIPGVLRSVAYIRELWQPDLVLGAGDLIAGQSALLPASRFAEMWAAFDQAIAAPLRHAGIPYAFAMGNHDASSLRHAAGTFIFQREREAARQYWQQAQHHNVDFIDAQDFPFHYSFVQHGVFIAVWDASSANIHESQRAWLRQQLSSPAAQQARFRVLVGHLPLYGLAEGRNQAGEVLHQGELLRQELEQHGLQLYISGHHHAYYPARRGELLLLNTGGVGARRLLGSNRNPQTTVTIMDIVGLDNPLWPVRFQLTTFDIHSWQTIPLEALPSTIDGFGGRITRMDLEP